VVSDISTSINEVVEAINNIGGTAIAQTCDISDWESVSQLVQTAVSEFGRVDCAVNSAGIAGKVSLATHDYPFDGWHQQIAINLTGPWYFLKAATTQMLAQGGGSIVLVASAAGLRGQPNNSPYAASKHGDPYDHARPQKVGRESGSVASCDQCSGNATNGTARRSCRSELVA